MSFAEKAARGAAWTVVTSLAARVVTVFSTWIITRFVSPDDYGAVMVASVIINTAMEFTRFGLYQYIVAKPDCGPQVVFHATFYHIVIGVLVIVPIILFREPLAPLFDAEQAIPYLPGMAIAMLLCRLAEGPEALLNRDFHFKALGFIRALGELVFAAITIVLAIKGFQGHAIVWGNLVQWFFIVLVGARVVGVGKWLKPHALTWEHTRTLFRFGAPLSVGQLAHYAAQYWDVLLMSRFFGTGVTGKYNLAQSLAALPITHIGEHIAEVFLPSFARMDDEWRDKALLRAMKLLNLIMFPMAIGLGVVAPTVTTFFFSSEWIEVAPMLLILAALSFVQPPAWPIGAYLQTHEKTRLLMLREILLLGLIVAAMFTFRAKGPLWVTFGVAIAYIGPTIFAMALLKSVTTISFWRVAFTMVPPFLACMPMIAAVFAVRYFFTGTLILGLDAEAIRQHPATLVQLIAEITTGALVYVPFAFLCAPHTANDLWSIIRDKILARSSENEDENQESP